MKHFQHRRPIGGKAWPKRWKKPIPGADILPKCAHIPMDRIHRLRVKHRNRKTRWRSNREDWFAFYIWQDWHHHRLSLASELCGGGGD